MIDSHGAVGIGLAGGTATGIGMMVQGLRSAPSAYTRDAVLNMVKPTTDLGSEAERLAGFEQQVRIGGEYVDLEEAFRSIIDGGRFTDGTSLADMSFTRRMDDGRIVARESANELLRGAGVGTRSRRLAFGGLVVAVAGAVGLVRWGFPSMGSGRREDEIAPGPSSKAASETPAQ